MGLAKLCDLSGLSIFSAMSVLCRLSLFRLVIHRGEAATLGFDARSDFVYNTEEWCVAIWRRVS